MTGQILASGAAACPARDLNDSESGDIYGISLLARYDLKR
mgnify:CR=1 FL=1